MDPASTILIVDDEPAMREALGYLLAAEGYDLAFAGDGVEALAKAKELVPDLILLDVMMPHMNGFEVCQRLRADPLLAEVPVILVTSRGDRDSRLQGFEAGADDYVTKPVDEIDLRARVRTTTRLNRYRRLLAEQARRQQAEDALHAVSSRHQAILAAVPDIIMEVDDDKIYTWANQAGFEFFGEDVLGQEVSFYFEGEQDIYGVVQSLFDGDENVIYVESWQRRQDGAKRLLAWWCRGLKNASGNVMGVLSTARDITERKQAEEMIVRHNKELVALYTVASTINQSLNLDHILDATLDKVLEVIEADAGWIQLLDQGSDMLSLVTHRGFSQEMIREIKTAKIKLGEGVTGKIAQSGQPIVMDNVSDDLELDLESVRQESLYGAAGVPIRLRDKALGVLGVFNRCPRQLTSQEVQLLIAIGHQLGVAIENVRLIEETAEVEILQELDRLRSELIANVSHELRTPLGLIKLCSSVLLEKDMDLDHETQQQFLHNIDQETDRLEVIVDNLLSLSRLESKQLRQDRHPTPMGELTSGVIKGLEIQFPQRHFVHDFPSEPLMATVDPRHIEQVLRNLLTNAVKYSPDEGAITVRGREDESRVIISVSDHGIGIPPEDLERVFERFYRVDNEVTQDVSGAGLGLAVCRGIVEAHGGRIWVESTLGVGSTFYFTLEEHEIQNGIHKLLAADEETAYEQG
ncbi:MAG: response regulator [Chloroflexi bacterium]|nr:response regulator [Chloroflexota bacterium]